ncbi:MAG: peptidylprolyl isomerase [Proteobacteria bacterium]|nr:peptidylprolyl isomerase [Pseudomonadota bacterium]
MRLFFLWAAFIVGAWGVPFVNAAEPMDAIIAIVGDVPITQTQVERESKRLENLNEGITAREARQEALDELIDRSVQKQLAQRLGIHISDALLAARIEELQQELGFSNEAELGRIAADEFLMSYPMFRERVRDDMLIQALFFREVFSRTQVYKDEVNQFLKFETAIGNLREYHLRHILISVADDGTDIDEKQDLALSLQARAATGEDFAQLAREYSDGDAASSGGNLGFKKEEELPEAFVVELQNINEGEISEVINTSRGFHFLKLEATRGGNIREAITRLRISHVFLPLTEEAEARELWNTIKNEEDFIAAVGQHSVDEKSIDKGGDIGWFDEQDIPVYFADTVKQMKVGDISPPVKSPFGWHLLHLRDSKKEALNIQGLREQARRVLRERRALAQRDVWIRRLRADTYVRILDPTFEYTIR